MFTFEIEFYDVCFISQASVMVLTMATLLVTARQYIGDPIDCMVEVTMMRNDDTLRMPSNGRVDDEKL